MIEKIRQFIKNMSKKDFNSKEAFLKEMINETDEKSEISEDEKDLVESIFELEETSISEIMIPRVDIHTVSFDATIRDVIELINKTGKSRILVYQNKVDNIAGIIYAKDILRFFDYEGDMRAIEIVRPPYFVPETKSVLSSLREFQKNRISIAVVIDEYGGVAGLVTMEDIIEEIVGELQDELDKEEVDYKQVSDNTYLVSGKMNIDDFNEALSTSYESEDVNTIGGLVISKLEHLPRRNEVISIDSLDFKILEIHKHRINRLLVKDTRGERRV
ncbi:MAG: hemolysin family protein [bacterium]|nr:hemolysin family protein [bacterium]